MRVGFFVEGIFERCENFLRVICIKGVVFWGEVGSAFEVCIEGFTFG